MRKTTSILAFSFLVLAVGYAQDHRAAAAGAGQFPDSASETAANLRNDAASSSPDLAPVSGHHPSEHFGVRDKFRFYLGETYLNPSFVTAPAFRAAIRMANPPGRTPTAYRLDWRQGTQGFGRNYGDAMAQRLSFQTARFATGALIREDPRYTPSSSRNPFARSLYAFRYTFFDRSDAGHSMPAFSNFAGAAAAGFAGDTYLPAGFANTTHAGQRATLQFAFFGAGNLYREFAPQMPKPLRTFIELIGR